MKKNLKNIKKMFVCAKEAAANEQEFLGKNEIKNRAQKQKL